jgi:hypothetical protein
MPEVNRIGSNLPNLEKSSSGAEQLMDILRDPQIKSDELSEKLKDALSQLPKPETEVLLDRIKNNAKDDPLAQSLNERMNKADTRDLIKTFDSKIPSVPLGGGKLPNVEPDIKPVPLGGGKLPHKEPEIPSVPLGGGNKRVSEPPQKLDLPSVPLGGGRKIGKDPDIQPVPLGGGKVQGKEPDIQSVPLGGRRKAEMDLQNQLLNKLASKDDDKS